MSRAGRGYEAFQTGYDLTNAGVDFYNGDYGSGSLNLVTGGLGVTGAFGRNVDVPLSANRSADNGLRQVGRGDAVRNTDPLADAQITELREMAGQVGLRRSDIEFTRIPSAYSDTFDKVFIGPNVYPSAVSSSSRSVLGRLTPRAVIAHEGGHLLTSRAGKALDGGSLLDEVQASLVGRQMRGLSNVERYQLLRDAAERARNEGQRVRDLLPQLPYFAE